MACLKYFHEHLSKTFSRSKNTSRPSSCTLSKCACIILISRFDSAINVLGTNPIWSFETNCVANALLRCASILYANQSVGEAFWGPYVVVNMLKSPINIEFCFTNGAILRKTSRRKALSAGA
eukprot:3193166-Pleurochrysis_carterae.AAC.2